MLKPTNPHAMKPLTVIAFITLFSQLALVLNKDQIVASDYPAFYSTSHLWNNSQNPYDLQSQCAEQVKFRPDYECLPFAHPPLLLPLMGMVTNENLESSYYRWIVTLAVLSLLAGFALYLLTKDKVFSVQSVLFGPLLIGVSGGQDIPLVLLAVASCFWSLLKGKDFIAGVVLSLALVKPQLALLIAIPIMVSRYKLAIGFAVGSLVAIAWSWMSVGTQGFKGIIEITRAMSNGAGLGVAQSTMPNVTGILVRSGINSHYSLIATIIALVVVSFLIKRFGVSLSTLSILLIATMFVSPHLHAHDLTLLVIPLFAIYKKVSTSLAAISLLILLAYGTGLDLPFVQLLMLGLAVYNLYQIRLDAPPAMKPSLHCGNIST